MKHLLEKNLLNKYVAVDISQDMIDIAESNIKSWFGKQVHFVSYVRDISLESMHDIIILESMHEENKIKNLVLFVGSTIENQRNWKITLDTLANCLSKEDGLLLGQTLDTKAAKLNFDFKYKDEAETIVEPNDFYKDWQELIIPNLLNISPDLYTVKPELTTFCRRQ